MMTVTIMQFLLFYTIGYIIIYNIIISCNNYILLGIRRYKLTHWFFSTITAKTLVTCYVPYDSRQVAFKHNACSIKCSNKGIYEMHKFDLNLQNSEKFYHTIQYDR